VGELCRYLLRQPPSLADRDHRLRVAAGAGLRPDIWKAFQDRFGIPRIIEMYGATEGNIALQNDGGPAGSVGRPHPVLADQLQLARFDLARGELVRGDDGRCVPCPDGEAGELLGRVGGRSAMEYDGYTDRSATERKLVRDAFEGGDAWFRTGDLLRRDPEGWYYFVDRIGDTFRWRGENVATQEVADVLNGAPGVSEANVYGVSLPGEDGRAGMAAVVLADGAPFDGAGFYHHAEAHLPAYARPAFVRIVPEMDVTGTLKQRKLALAAEGYAPSRVPDPLFIRDDAARTYVPFTPAVAEAVSLGRWRL
jgi:fatty-acyl-CoA synthase